MNVIELCFVDPVPDYVKEAVKTVVKIHEKEDKGDILVFLTGQDEVDNAVTLLSQHVPSAKSRVSREFEFPNFSI